MAVDFPGKAIKDDGNDILAPLASLLQGLSILPSQSDTKGSDALWSVKGTPTSVAILESGATALSKGWTVVIGALGGGAAVTAAVNGFWKSQSNGVQIVLLAGTALILIAAIVAIAVMVLGDVRGRALGAVEIYQARKEIALKFLEESLTVAQADKMSVAAAINPVSLGSTVVALAITGHQAQVEYVSSGAQGHVAGFKHNGTDMLVGWREGTSKEINWVPPSDLRVVQYTFPPS